MEDVGHHQAVIATLTQLGGAGLRVYDVNDARRAMAAQPGEIRVGLAHGAARADVDPKPFDILLCGEARPPAPWVGSDAPQVLLAALEAQVRQQPEVASIAAQVLRMTLALEFEDALVLESLAFSTLLSSRGFKAWRRATPVRSRQEPDAARVLIDARPDVTVISLNRPQRRNAVDAEMRDALCEALSIAADLPNPPSIVLRGEGPSFCAGGDLDEFGQADDPALAHLVRTHRSATLCVHRLRERMTVFAHGACVGAGAEIAAAAGNVVAAPDAVFKLPEITMGLIPGAGGTASIPRRIGRHRACYMAIAGAPIDARTALDWGLVDAVGFET